VSRADGRVAPSTRAATGRPAAPRTHPRLAWGLFTVCTGLIVATWALEVVGPRHEPGYDEFSASASVFSLAVVGFALFGALIASRVAGNPLGWILVGFALVMASSPLAYQYAVAGLPGQEVAAWLTSWLWVVPIALLAEAALRFPHGRRPSSGWRWVQHAARTGVAVSLGLGIALWPQRGMALLTVGDAWTGTAGALADVALPLTFGAFAAAATSLLVRLRRAQGVERLQLKWLVFAMLVAASGLVAFAVDDLLLDDVQPVVGDVLSSVGILGIPLAMWIAITRHRLYEIDRLISRTLSYAALSTVLLGVYVVVAVVLPALLGVRSDLLVATATLAVAGLFRPLRRRVQAAVDRRFNRTRYDAERTIDRFVERLRRGTGRENPLGDLVRVVAGTMHPATVSVWLRPPVDARSGGRR